jgi:hypothetical protein
MRYGWLLVVALAAMSGAVAVVYAAPDGFADGNAPAPLPAQGVVGPRGMSVVRPMLPGGDPPVQGVARRPSSWVNNQGTWVGLIDDFELGAEPDPAKGWIYREDTNGNAYGEYLWGISQCRGAHGSRKSLWAIGDGVDGSQLACGSPYPHGTSSAIWLLLDTSYWPTDTNKLDLVFDFWLNLRTYTENEVEGDGLFIVYRLPKSGPAGGDTTEPVILANLTGQDPANFWYEPWRIDLLHAREVYPQPDGSFREFNLAGKPAVTIEFLFQSGMKTDTVFEDGVFIDNVRLESSDGPGTPVATTPPPATTEAPTDTPTATSETPGPTSETPIATTDTPSPGPTTPTPTRIPFGKDIFLPVALVGDFAPPPAPQTPGPATDTAEPGTTPTEVVGPTETPPPGPGDVTCRDWVVNGGFEQGPNVGWSFESNAQKPDGTPLVASDVILKYVDFAGQLLPPPGGGEWVAFMGSGANIDMRLYQTEPVALPAPEQVVSATLTFDIGILTQETPDGQDNDFFGIYVIDQSDKAEAVAAVTEESDLITLGSWNELSLTDFQRYVTLREGWETMRLMFRSWQDDANMSQHALDSVRLNVCTVDTPLPAGARRVAPDARPVLSARTLPGRPLRAW